MHFVFPKIGDIFIKDKVLCFSDIGGYFIIILLLFHNFLEPNWRFILKMDSDVRDGFTNYS